MEHQGEEGARVDAWRRTSAGLFMRCDDADAGQLVRVADVLLWLIEGKGIPRLPAVGQLCDALEKADPAPVLYAATAGDYAKAIEGDAARFGFDTAKTWCARLEAAEKTMNDLRGKSAWNYNIGDEDADRFAWKLYGVYELAKGEFQAMSNAHPQFVEPGVPALARLVRERWAKAWRRVAGPDGRLRPQSDAESLNDGRLPCVAVAVRVADAGRIWGWGVTTALAAAPVELKTYPDLVQHRKAHPKSDWDMPANQCDLLAAEEKRAADAGEQGVRARMAEELGVTSRRIGQLIQRGKGSRATVRDKRSNGGNSSQLRAV